MNKLSVNGIELAYDVRGDGPPLLLLHGFFGSSGDGSTSSISTSSPRATD